MISIIVPIYNMQEYLDKCLHSIFCQSYVDFEVLLIDDGSTDKSADICKKYCDMDSRFQYYYQENKGLSGARNHGLKLAKGEWISFVDSDDWIGTEFLNAMWQEAQHSYTDIVVSGYERVDEEGKSLGKNFLDNAILSRQQALLMLCKDIITNHAWNKLYRKEMWNDICFPEGRVYEDIFVMYKIFMCAKKVSVISACHYYYLFRSGSILATKKFLFDNFYALKERYNILCQYSQKQQDITNEMYQEAFLHIIPVMHSIIYDMPKELKLQKPKEYKEIQHYWQETRKWCKPKNKKLWFQLYFPRLFLFLRQVKSLCRKYFSD